MPIDRDVLNLSLVAVLQAFIDAAPDANEGVMELFSGIAESLIGAGVDRERVFVVLVAAALANARILHRENAAAVIRDLTKKFEAGELDLASWQPTSKN